MGVGACLGAAMVLLAGLAVQRWWPDSVERISDVSAQDTGLSGAITGLYALEFDNIEAPVTPSRAGALIATSEAAYFIDRLGGFHRIEEDGLVPVAVQLPFDLPDMDDRSPPELANSKTGVRDAQFLKVDDGWQLFLSVRVPNPQSNCQDLQIVQLNLADQADATLAAARRDDWIVLASEMQCLDDAGSAGLFHGGGALAVDGAQLYYMTGRNLAEAGGQSDLPNSVAMPEGSGTIWRYQFATDTKAPFATGLRNTQGMILDDRGRLLATDHGPRGGDELNLVEQGKDYGWPRTSLGSTYLDYSFGRNDLPGQHDGAALPLYAWLPSIAISSVLQLRGTAFSAWRGDLLIGALVGGKIYRLRMEGDRVVYAEAIEIGWSVRDMVEGPDGSIYLLRNVSPEILRIRPASSAPAQVSLRLALCAPCHQLSADAPRVLAGSSLVGILDRPIAAQENYDYSPAMRQLGGRWTPARLRALLEDGQGFVPGSHMPDMRLNKAESALVVEALQ